MTVLIDRRSVVLSSIQRQYVSPELTIDAATAAIQLKLKRPTILAPSAWLASGKAKVSIVVTMDGEEYWCSGQTSGGVRKNFKNEDAEYYVLTYTPPYGYFGERAGLTKRLGERSKTAYTARCELRLLEGEIVSEIEVSSTESPAPAIEFHSSVAFDAATDGQELNGDGVLSITHTASGSDRAAFAGCGSGSDPVRTSTSITYAGNSMTEMWDLTFGTVFSNAGYRLAGTANIPTGAQTVTNTLSGAPGEHALGVITMTGVDSTTPVGTPVTATGTASPASVTVGSVGTDDLVVDCFFNGDNEGSIVLPTVGADQTTRNSELLSNPLDYETFTTSSQLGSAGGVMSWSWSGFVSDGWGLGAVAFKPAAAAAGQPASKRFGGIPGMAINQGVW